MPKFNVRLGRLVTAYEICSVEVDAPYIESAKKAALEIADGTIDWTERERWTPEGGDVEAIAVWDESGAMVE